MTLLGAGLFIFGCLVALVGVYIGIPQFQRFLNISSQPIMAITNVALVLCTIVLVILTLAANDRAARVFQAENRPLIDVTPIYIVQNLKGTHAATILSVANYSGFAAHNVGIDLKYGEENWIGEWLKAEDDAKNKGDAQGVVKGTPYPAAPKVIIGKLEPGETRKETFEGPIAALAGSLNLEDVVAKGKGGLTVVIRSTWQNEKGHVFDAIHEYRLVGTTNSAKGRGRAFTFIPKGIVSQKDVVRN